MATLNYLVSTDGQHALWVNGIWPEPPIRDLALLKARYKAYAAGVSPTEAFSFAQ